MTNIHKKARYYVACATLRAVTWTVAIVAGTAGLTLAATATAAYWFSPELYDKDSSSPEEL